MLSGSKYDTGFRAILPRVLHLDPRDDTAVEVTGLSRGERVLIGPVAVALREDIPAGHDGALRTIAHGVTQ